MADDDQQQIRQLMSDWLQATQRQDTDKVLSLIADDAVFLVAGHEPFGKAAFAQASLNQKNSSVQLEGQSEVVELQVLGDWAFAVTKLTLTIRRPNSEPMNRSGNTLTLFRKTDGVWQLARDANLLK